MFLTSIKELLFKWASKPQVRILTPAIAGFIAYGTWGCIANSSYESDIWIKAGLVQGTMSFFTNLVIASLMETIYKAFDSKWLVIIITIPSIAITVYTAHAIAGTPEIILTIAPSVVIGSFYVYGYATTLTVVKIKKKQNGAA